MTDTTPSNVCEHGRLRRACPQCDLLADIAERDAAIARYRRELLSVFEAMESRYDGAPDSQTLWMGEHLDGIRAAMLKQGASHD